MLGFKQIFMALSLVLLFFGVISSVILNGAACAVQRDKESCMGVLKGLGETVFNSQEVVQDSYLKLNSTMKSDDEWRSSMSTWLFFRVVAGSMVTIAIFYILWKFWGFLVPSEKGDLGAKILVIVLTVFVIWGTTVLYSYQFSDEGFVPPFHGWVTVATNPDIGSSYISGVGYTSPIEKIGMNQSNSTGG